MPRMHEEKGWPLLGSSLALARAPHLFMADLALRHGGIAGFRAMNRAVVVVADPDMVHELLVAKWQRFVRGRASNNLGILGKGLLTMSGEEWFERRRLAQSAFSRDTLEEVARYSREGAASMIAGWRGEQETAGSVLLEAGLLRLSMSVIAGMLLSRKVTDVDADRIGETLRRGLDLVLKRNTAPWAAPMWLPTPSNRSLLKVRRILTDFITSSLSSRPPDEANDLHQTMAAARDPRSGRGFSPEALVEETKTLFFAGYETAATGLTWTLYLLARHPDVTERLAVELAQVLDGRDPVQADLAQLTYLRAVLQEAMRVYPPVYAIPRQAVDDDSIGGYTIRRGTTVIASISGLHASPAWGDDRDTFNPARFLSSGWPRRAYIPFGAGRHLCIGSDFAVTEMSLVVAMVVQRYRLRTRSEVGTRARVTLVPDGPIQLELEPRS